MGWGDETGALTQDIIDSHKAREEGLEQMRGDTRNFLIQTEAELREMSVRLKADLAKVTRLWL